MTSAMNSHYYIDLFICYGSYPVVNIVIKVSIHILILLVLIALKPKERFVFSLVPQIRVNSQLIFS